MRDNLITLLLFLTIAGPLTLGMVWAWTQPAPAEDPLRRSLRTLIHELEKLNR